ncbi:MAG: pilus assembly PilX family protein [Pontibacterium sp.]
MKKQQGSLLLVTLIILLIMTLTGMAGIEVTGLEEKMAANMRDRQVAFETAEATLLQAENYLESLDDNELPVFDADGGTGGFYLPSASGTPHWEDWDNLSTRPFTAGGGAYIVEELLETAVEESIEVGRVKEKRHYYRITARAQGLISSSQVVLQSVYKR